MMAKLYISKGFFKITQTFCFNYFGKEIVNQNALFGRI